jgi:acyl transferase domain-containing protein/thioesterase domain-containing protein/NADP-dependent 3-hydroxy acid dehydrogenase YdfG/acyl carrier protein
MSNPQRLTHTNGLEVAVIGMVTRFPGAENVEEFWANLRDGVESVTRFTDEELLSMGVAPEVIHDPRFVKARAIRKDVEMFDASFFGFAPSEAEILDPQQRHFLECAWEALERAGYTAETYQGRIGVYAGAGVSTYYLYNLISDRETLRSFSRLQLANANEKDFLPMRVSYKLNLNGPSICVQTTCSTSLVAVHMACQALLSGDCEMALAGGVTLFAPALRGYYYQDGGILSPDGHCRAFDAAAAGIVPGDGVGIVVLKKLEDAIGDGDHIYAVIKGSAVNNDGAHKVSFTAPSEERQSQLIRAAQIAAEVEPETITYVEAHGTGTTLGDPIEIAGLTKAFRHGTKKKKFCAIGSVKTNIGHLDTAAGVAGFIKTVLALDHKMIPPSLHFESPNPNIDFDNSPFYVNNRLAEWKANGVPLRAGVSSFGMGGTNAHVILEEAPPREPSGPSRPDQLLVLSAKSATSLEAMTINLVEHLKRRTDLNLADAAYTLQVGRQPFNHRRALVCREREDAIMALESNNPERVITKHLGASGKSVVFMFPGQGSQYINMGLDLYNHEPVFRDEVDRCSELLIPHLGLDLRRTLYPRDELREVSETQLNQTYITQPALFTVEISLAKLWMSWGVQPQAMIGHSIGEYVAACLAGTLGLEEALELVVSRGKLMQSLPVGAMLAVPLPESDIQALAGEELSLAAVNHDSLCVISGPTQAIDELETRLFREGLSGHRLHTSHAFHSKMVDPILEAFTGLVKKVDLKPPKIPYISNVTGKWVKGAEAVDKDYWAKHLRQTVRFADGIRELLKEPGRILLEVGPGKTLVNLVKRRPDLSSIDEAVSTLPNRHDRNSATESMLGALGRLWAAGLEVNWEGFHAGERRRRTPLPTYIFDRKRYWIESKKTADLPGKTTEARAKSPVSSPAVKGGLEDCLFAPSWTESDLSSRFLELNDQSTWLIFIDKQGLGVRIAERLKQAGRRVTSVDAGGQFTFLEEDHYSVNPASQGDYVSLLLELRKTGKIPQKILHLWGVTTPEDRPLNYQTFEECQEKGVYSLLFLVRALKDTGTPGPVELGVVSSNMQRLAGDLESFPQKAPVLGFCGAIPQEYEGITCRSIDVDALEEGRAWGEWLIDALILELVAGAPDAVVAYRRNRRWALNLEAAKLDQEGCREKAVGDNGVYLITGGSNELGLKAAERLAMEGRVKLALVDPYGLPGREESGQPATDVPEGSVDSGRRECLEESEGARKIALDMYEEESLITRWEAKIGAETNVKRIEDYRGLTEKANALCSGYILRYFTANNIDVKKGKVYDEREMLATLSIQVKYKKFFDFMVASLEEDEIVRRRGGEIEFLIGSEEAGEPEALRGELDKLYPEFKGIFDLLRHCVENYDNALSGAVDAISVLYPDGTSSFLASAGLNVLEYSDCRTYLTLSREIISKIVKASAGEKIRILEIGGGNGLLTKTIIPAILKENVEYTFTDLGKSFVVRASRQAANFGLGFMKFGVLDISKDPVAQGYQEQTVDILVGLDVVHATRSVAESIGNLKKLLSPNGVMILLESVGKMPRWEIMIWGLAEGWWYFKDNDLRRESPLLSLGQWETVIQDQGFRSVMGYPKDSTVRLKADHGLIVAQNTDPAPDGRRVENGVTSFQLQRLEKLREIERLGSEVLVIRADVTDREQMSAAIDNIKERFGAIDGVIHAAESGGGMAAIHDTTVEMLRREFKAKVAGALILDDLLKGAKLNYFALCSSVAADAGQAAQAGRCAATAFLDAYASSLQSRNGTRAISISWNQSGGSASSTNGKYNGVSAKEVKAANGMLWTFGQVLSGCQAPQVVISNSRPIWMKAYSRDAIESSPAGASEALNGKKELTNMSVKLNKHSRPDLKSDYVAPRNETERSLVALWQSLFNIERLGIQDNFFDLGGDSLMALTLNARLQKAFQVNLPMHALLGAPTIADLARAIEAARPSRNSVSDSATHEPASRLIALQRGSSERNLFLIHPGGGGVFGYRDLALSLGPKFSVFGIQSQGLEDQEGALNQVEEMASNYLDSVRSTQPYGSYLLGGSSFGGMVAFEMAQQLVSSGEEVGLLALFDTPGPRQMESHWGEENALLTILANNNTLLEPDKFQRLGLDLRLHDSLKKMKAINKGVINEFPEQARHLVHVWKKNAEAMYNYKLRPYPGRIAFFRARERSDWLPPHPESPWVEVAEQGIDIHLAPGGHETMLAPPHVQMLADTLRRCCLRRFMLEEGA